MASPYVSDQDRLRLKLYEIQSDIFDIDRARSTAGFDLHELQKRFLTYAAETGAAGGASRYANFMVAYNILRSDRPSVIDFVKRAQSSPDTILGDWALNQGALMMAGDKPFPLVGTGVEGQSVNLAQFRGKVVFVDFWGTGCSSCIASLPQFKRLYDEYKPLGIEFVGVIIDDEDKREQIKQILAKHNVDWPQIFAGKDVNAFLKKYAVIGLPKYFVIDQRGRFVTSGQMTKMELQEVFATLLQDKGAGK
jgi:thiol-disulfide isomerase/thioredoxin